MPSSAPLAPLAAPAAARIRRAPASAKSEQRIRDILRVGREVFAEKGFERATTTEIAQRLGISEATVFTYFHGKRELCLRVIADWYDEIVQAMESGMPVDAPVMTTDFMKLPFPLTSPVAARWRQGAGTKPV